MSKHLISCFVLLFLLSSTGSAQPLSFSYQGKLQDGGLLASGTYEIKFTLFDAAADGNEIGSEIKTVVVSAGVFNVELYFGVFAFNGPDRWLEIAVRKPGDPPGYTILTPRQKVASVPYALYSLRASGVDLATAGNTVVGSINDASTTLTINDNRLPANLVRLNPTGQQPGAAAADTDAVLNIGTSSTSYPASLKMNNDGAFLLEGTPDGGTASGGVPASGVGTRMFWHPRKAAFRAGQVNTLATDTPEDPTSPGNQWDEPNIGYYSVAIGENNQASGRNSVALGRNARASGSHAFAVGDYAVASGASSVAMGYHASTNSRDGSFLFSDRSALDIFRASLTNSANWRVSNGFRIFTAANLSTGVTIQSGSVTSNWGQSGAVISTSTGAMLTTGGVWQNASSEDLKDRFEAVNARSILDKVLDLPIRTWSYKVEGDRVRHLGPTSQDFFRAFSLGTDERSIGTVDADGVALAAIQGLAQKVEEKNRSLEAENAALRSKLEQQQKMLDALKKAVCSMNHQADVCIAN